MQQFFGDTLQEIYAGKLRRNAVRRKALLDQIRTPEEFRSRQKALREKIASAFQLPSLEEKCSLLPKVTGVVNGDGFRVEKVFYHSRSRLTVTASLYIPDGASHAPAVLYLAGSSPEGKENVLTQRAAMELTSCGFVVLVPDQLGTGERSLLVDIPEAEGIAGDPEKECRIMSRQMLAAGEFFSSWVLWDAVRSFDYLESRPEVDPERICVTGDIMSVFLAAADERPFAVAPCCRVSSWLRRAEKGEPLSAAEELPFFSGLGCEAGDLLLAHAPRPLLLWGEESDEICGELKHFYELLGAKEKLRIAAVEEKDCETVCGFLAALPDMPVLQRKPGAFKSFAAGELQVLPEGQSARFEGKLQPIDFIRLLADDFRAMRPRLSREELCGKVRNMLRLDERELSLPEHCDGGSFLSGDRLFSCIGIKSDEDVHVVLYRMASAEKDAAADHVLLYVPHADAAEEMADRSFETQGELYGISYRKGESSAIDLILGTPLLGGQVRDILAALRWAEHESNKKLRIIARGDGCIPALLAALLRGEGADVTLLAPPESVDAMLRTRVGNVPGPAVPWGILEFTDLPELIEAVGAKIVK